MTSAESSLQLGATSLALLKAMLQIHTEVADTETGRELMQALDCAWVSAERLRLELEVLGGDLFFLDDADAASPA